MTYIEQHPYPNSILPDPTDQIPIDPLRPPGDQPLTPQRIVEMTMISLADASIIADHAAPLFTIHTFSELDWTSFFLSVMIHDGKRRVVSQDPYAVHPIDVALILAKAGRGDMVPEALLHDTVEDSPKKPNGESIITSDSLSATLHAHDPIVVLKTLSHVEAVTAPTFTPEEKKRIPWIDRKIKALEKVLSHPDPDVRLLKTADLLANASNILLDWHRINKNKSELREKSFSEFSASQDEIIERYVFSLQRLYCFSVETGEENILLRDLCLQVEALVKEPGIYNGHPELLEDLALLRDDLTSTQELGATP